MSKSKSKAVDPKKRRTTKQQQNAVDFLNSDPKATKTAAYRHGYNCTRMKPRTVNRNAVKLFNLPHIKPLLEKARELAAEEAHIDAAWILRQAGRVAAFSIGKFIVVKNGRPMYDFSKATADDWYCISEITIDPAGFSEDGLIPLHKVKLKSKDSLKALDMCGKHVSVQAWKEQLALAGVVTNINMSVEEYKKARQEMLAADDC